jgi:catechol 2,3-dioxygenase-like lactoylglutathione lyase family enzyme
MRRHSTVLVTRHLEQLRDFYTTTLGVRDVEDFGGCVVLDCGLSIWQPSNEHPVRRSRRSVDSIPRPAVTRRADRTLGTTDGTSRGSGWKPD